MSPRHFHWQRQHRPVSGTRRRGQRFTPHSVHAADAKLTDWWVTRPVEGVELQLTTRQSARRVILARHAAVHGRSHHPKVGRRDSAPDAVSFGCRGNAPGVRTCTQRVPCNEFILRRRARRTPGAQSGWRIRRPLARRPGGKPTPGPLTRCRNSSRFPAHPRGASGSASSHWRTRANSSAAR